MIGFFFFWVGWFDVGPFYFCGFVGLRVVLILGKLEHWVGWMTPPSSRSCTSSRGLVFFNPTQKQFNRKRIKIRRTKNKNHKITSLSGPLCELFFALLFPALAHFAPKPSADIL